MSRELLKLISEKFTSGNSVEVERITITRGEYEEALAKPEHANPAAKHWHDLYQAKCQEFHDKQTILGTEIVALEEEIAELKKEQVEQEPVAWVTSTASGYNTIGYDSSVINQLSDETLLYTASPRKEWVGLTYKEIEGILDCGRGNLVDIKKAEQTLKDKNT
jgi:hypothetical protein